jgi:2-keto-4-pentenoate hydratase/2-oxohepta-3-ene-1,7-dioic acid hydratase in catechol pathway
VAAEDLVSHGELKQHGSTADLLFGIPELLEHISQANTLEPGNLVPTGTPVGVGPVKAGNRVEVWMAGIGVLKNEFQAE